MYKTVNIPQQTYTILENISRKEKASKVSIVDSLIKQYDDQLRAKEMQKTYEVDKKMREIAGRIKLRKSIKINLEDIDVSVGYEDELV